MAKGLDIKGMRPLLLKLGKVKAGRFLRGVLRMASLSIRSKVAKYPRSTAANVDPGPGGRWYERGYGSKYHRITDGRISGSKTSELLGRQWYSNVSGFSAKIGNRAGYAPVVQGRDDQASIHKGHGWVTLEDAADEEIPAVERRLQQRVDRLLAE